MAIPGMDLQAQYEQTLQNTIGKSQRDRLQDVRKQQTLANTDWAQRGVGQGAQRMAGFQEVNPSSMPNMSDETRSFIKPLLGTYQEGGQNVEGFYGKDNPYTQGGLESILSTQGYARAPSSLEGQFKSVGLKLPNAYGQNYYNAQHEAVGNDIANYQQQLQAQQARQGPTLADSLRSKIDPSINLIKGDQIDYYTQRGFVPGQDNGNWRWSAGQPMGVRTITGDYSGSYVPPKVLEQQVNDKDAGMLGGFSDNARVDPSAQADQQWSDEVSKTLRDLYPEGSGSWSYYKDGTGKALGDHPLEYSPTRGFGQQDDTNLKFNPEKWMPQLTMALIGSMNPAAGAMVSTARTGLNTGDWKQAIGQGALSYLGSSLGGAYGADVGGAMGLEGALANSVGSGLISTGVNAAGNLALGNKVNWGNVAGGLVGSMGGSLANSSLSGLFDNKVIGDAVGQMGSSAVKGGLNKALLQKGSTKDIALNSIIAGLGSSIDGYLSPKNKQPGLETLKSPTKTNPIYNQSRQRIV